MLLALAPHEKNQSGWVMVLEREKDMAYWHVLIPYATVRCFELISCPGPSDIPIHLIRRVVKEIRKQH